VGVEKDCCAGMDVGNVSGSLINKGNTGRLTIRENESLNTLASDNKIKLEDIAGTNRE